MCGRTCRKLYTLAVPAGTRNALVALAVIVSAIRKLPPCLREVSARAHVSSRRWCLGPTCLRGVLSDALVSLRKRVFARPCVFATTRVFARPVFGKRLRPLMSLRDDASIRLTCREVSSYAHVTSGRCVPSQTCLWQTSSDKHMESLREVCRAVRSGSVFGRPDLFAPRSVFTGHVSSNTHVFSLSSPSMCLLTPRCLRRPLANSSVPNPVCLQNLSLVFGRCVHSPQATTM